VLGHVSLGLDLVADRFLSVWNHIESFKVIVFLVGEIERFQGPRRNQISKRDCMVLAIYLTQTAARLTRARLLLFV